MFSQVLQVSMAVFLYLDHSGFLAVIEEGFI